ncbi:DUF2470 domain-containing protein [Leifsonia sp. NPDC058230]|uniref:DUF2470 domain-containing protein n=1 Tax=Leifsonia sp. NPDC058230 TaxID=3346391 RepID=UPI0036DA9FDD
MPTFDPDVVNAVLRHMNGDHRDDNLIIARANGAPEASAATMIALDENAGVWSVRVGDEDAELRIPWTVPVAERADIRKAVVFLYRDACRQLGIEPRTD